MKLGFFHYVQQYDIVLTVFEVRTYYPLFIFFLPRTCVFWKILIFLLLERFRVWRKDFYMQNI